MVAENKQPGATQGALVALDTLGKEAVFTPQHLAAGVGGLRGGWGGPSLSPAAGGACGWAKPRPSSVPLPPEGDMPELQPPHPKKIHTAGTSASPKSHRQWCPSTLRTKMRIRDTSPLHGDPVPTPSLRIAGNL